MLDKMLAGLSILKRGQQINLNPLYKSALTLDKGAFVVLMNFQFIYHLSG